MSDRDDGEQFQSVRKRVLVVGGGPSGLTAVKACLEEEGFEPLCLEKTLDIGGLWCYSDDPPVPGTAGIYESLVINTCKEMTAFSDFPIPEDVPQFMTHQEVLKYFRSYAKHFDLLRHIRFNTEVCSIRPAKDYRKTGRWQVRYVVHAFPSCPARCLCSCDVTFGKDTGRADESLGQPELYFNDHGRAKDTEDLTAPENGELEADAKPMENLAAQSGVEGAKPTEAEERASRRECREVVEEFDGVMVCTGHHTVPFVPNLPGMEDFQGTILHSHQYKRPAPFAGQNVVVVGIGNSAADIAVDLAKTAQKVFLSTRRGSWIVGRTAGFSVPTDMVASSRLLTGMPLGVLQWLAEKMAAFHMDHDKLGLKPKHKLLNAHPTINDELPFHLMNGRVVARPDVKRVLAQGVLFQDGAVQEADAIILATGYDYRLDVVDPGVVQVAENHVRLYKYVFPPDLPHATLAIIGLVQPVGSFMPVIEQQARWFVNLMLGRVKLPPRELMLEDIEKKIKSQRDQYYRSRRHTLETLWIDCMNETAEQFGARPDLWRLLRRDPFLALRCYLGPCLPAQYRLQGPKPWAQAPDYIRNVWARTFKTTNHVRDPNSNGSRGGNGGAGSGDASALGASTGKKGCSHGEEGSFCRPAAAREPEDKTRCERSRFELVGGASVGKMGLARVATSTTTTTSAMLGKGPYWLGVLFALLIFGFLMVAYNISGALSRPAASGTREF